MFILYTIILEKNVYLFQQDLISDDHSETADGTYEI